MAEKEGEFVSKGEPLLEIETDKAVMEVESPAEGVLAGVSVGAGTEVPVGRTIAWILKPGETVPAEETRVASGRVSAAARTASPSAPSALPQSGVREFKISPKARRLASESGVDLAQVQGSGSEGEILASDILAAAESKQAARTASHAESGSPIARLMAERTTQSWTTVPHFFVIRELDASNLNRAREHFAQDLEQSHGVKLTHSDLMVALVARVLAKHPKMNATWADGAIRFNPDVNVSLAMAVEEGVVTPVIPHADRADLGAIAFQRHELTQRARAHKLRPSELAGGTFTISNLGMFDVDAFTAIIPSPQVAILAVGRIADRAISVEGQPAIRPMVTLTLSSDHRVIDGARAAEFMRDVADSIANPRKWLAGN